MSTRLSRASRQRSVRDPQLLERAVRARLQHGRLWRARRLLRAQRDCARRELLWHLVTENTPLPEPACTCASDAGETAQAPASTWLKCFFFISSDMHEYGYYLCLSCHQSSQEYFRYGCDPAIWYRMELSTFAERSFWFSRSLFSPYPGRWVVSDPKRFVRWVRKLRESASAYVGI